MTLQVNVQEAKTHLSSLLASVSTGKRVVIARNGKPVATLEPVEDLPKRELGFLSFTVPDSFFDELPDEELAAWERE